MYGISDSGIGVTGFSQSNYGIFGISNSIEGVLGITSTGDYAIRGWNQGLKHGVYGKADSTNSYAVYGQNTKGTGVQGESQTGTAVAGVLSDNGFSAVNGVSFGTGFGVRGQGNDAASVGVRGQSENGRGVYGSSLDSFGVHGFSFNDYGVYAESVNLCGVYGKSFGSFGIKGVSTNSHGAYFKGADGFGSIVLGGSNYSGGKDDGVIMSNPDSSSSDIFLVANGSIQIDADKNSNNDGSFGVNKVYGNVSTTIKHSSGDNYVFSVEGPTETDFWFDVESDGDVVLADDLFVGDSVRVTGNMNVMGNISKGGGSFKIDHPLNPENKYLYHSFVESPDMMNVYNGNIVTDMDGLATVKLPSYFMALNRDFRYQLTVIGTFAQAIIKEEVSNNTFVIQTSETNVKVSWQVTGIRQDAYANKNRIEVEVDKNPSEQGLYIHPTAHGKGLEKSIGSHKNSRKERKIR